MLTDRTDSLELTCGTALRVMVGHEPELWWIFIPSFEADLSKIGKQSFSLWEKVAHSAG
jgi:hypothetical protein